MVNNMFENLLYQNASLLLSDDIRRSNLPQSLLFAGPPSSGKLTAALETARVLSCTGEKRGDWNCTCPDCQRNKALIAHNILIAGNSSRILEIKAASNTFLTQYIQNTNHLFSSRYLYIRAVRKLTLRFADALWEGEDKQSKFAPLLQSIDENLELLNPNKVLPDSEEELKKILSSIEKDAEKLEDSYLYASLPVSQVRKISSWAHLTSSSRVKVVIIENAEKMQEASRNALLKTLEEPPKDTVFILLTQNRSAILPTILSRVRTYTFTKRTEAQEKEVINRVFHNVSQFSKNDSSIDGFLQGFLSADLDTVKKCAFDFFENVANGHVPDIKKIVSYCSDFKPAAIFTVFLENLIEAQKKLLKTPCGSECSFRIVSEIKKCRNNFSVYNQNAQGSLESLARSLMQINHFNDGAFRKVFEKSEEAE